MSQLPKISPQLRDSLAAKGYDGNAAYEINRLPSFAIPRTAAYNLTTAFLAGGSLLGLYLTRSSKYMSKTFGIALALTVGLDYMQRRQLDNVHNNALTSNQSFEQQLERFPQFKKAYQTVNEELDSRIQQLEGHRRNYR